MLVFPCIVRCFPNERRRTVLRRVVSIKSSEAQGLVNQSASWDLHEGQPAAKTTWPLKVAALMARQRGLEVRRRDPTDLILLRD